MGWDEHEPTDPYLRHGSRMSTRHHRRACAAPDPDGLSEFQLRTLNCVRAEAFGDLAIGIDASLSGRIDGLVWSVSDRGALDRVAQIAERKYCRPHA